jgi:hypothetical protein
VLDPSKRERERERERKGGVLTCYWLTCYEHMLLVHTHPASQGNFLLNCTCTADTLTVVVQENGLEMRKLWPTKVK